MSSKHPPTIDLDAVQSGLDGLAHQPPAGPVPPDNGGVNEREPQGSPAVPQLGAEAAENMTKLSKAAAGDIRRLGLLAFKAGKQVQEECEQMARDVESNGSTVALHLTGLSQLLADVGMSNRETLRRLSGGSSPSIVPTTGNNCADEQAATTAKALGVASLSKRSDVRIPKFLGES